MPADEPEPRRARDAWLRSSGPLLLIFVEAAALCHLLVALLHVETLARYVLSNAGHALRRQLVYAPPLAGLMAAVATGASPLRSHAQTLARAGAPLLVLWAVPGLLVRSAYEGRELTLLLLAALAVVLAERVLRHAVPTLNRSTGSSRARTARRVDVAAALSIAAFAWFACHGSIRIHHKMMTSNYDLGLFENLFWNTLHGRHGIALEGRYFGEHAEFLLYLLLPIYALFPRTETLLAAQALLMASAAVPLYLLAKRWLKSAPQAWALVAIYLAYPAVHGPVFYDFHFLALSSCFVLWAAYFLALRRYRWFWAAVLLAMCCREDVALGVGAVGVGLLTIRRYRRVALALALAGIAWSSR